MDQTIVIRNEFFYFLKPHQLRAEETTRAILDDCKTHPTLKIIRMIYKECDDSFPEYLNSIADILQTQSLPNHLEQIEIFHEPTKATYVVWQRQ